MIVIVDYGAGNLRSVKKAFDYTGVKNRIISKADEFKNVEFVLVGDGSLRDKFLKKVEEQGIADYVDFPGFIENDKLPLLLDSSDIYVSTSFSDGRSVSLMEAMACGAFPVVSDIPANRDMIKDGENGYLFPADSSKIMAEKLIMAIRNEGLRSEQIGENRKFIEENFDLDMIMRELFDIYENLVR